MMGCQPPSTAHGLPSQARCAVAAATNGSHILPIGMVDDFAKVTKEARKRKVRMDVTHLKGYILHAKRKVRMDVIQLKECILYLPSWISVYLPSSWISI